MTHKRYPLIIFDWDGTLVDSEQHITRSMQQAFIDAGFDAPEYQQVRCLIGLSLPIAVRKLLPENATDAQYDLVSAGYKKHFLDSADDEFKLFSGVETTIEQLANMGYIMAIATGKSRHGLEKALKLTHINRYFSASRCADETASKPNPLMLNELLDSLNFSAKQSLMIGDTSFDLEMAQNAGIDSIAVNYGAHDPHTLTDYHPLTFLDQFSHLVDWLQNQR